MGNTVDAYVNTGGIILTNSGTTTSALDPAGSCSVGIDVNSPHAIFGYVKDAAYNPLAGVGVTVTNGATGEFVLGLSDAAGRYDVDLAGLPSGYANGTLFEVTIPNPGYNSTNINTYFPYDQVNITVDATLPTSQITFAPAANNTGSWLLNFVWNDPPVNGYSSGVHAVDIYVETPLTPGVYNFWAGQMDTWINGTMAYTPAAGQGAYNFYSIATDNAGNVEPVPGVLPDVSCFYDTVAPTASVNAPTTSNNQTFPVTYVMNDAAPSSGMANVSLWWTYDGGTTWTEYGDDAATGTFNVDVSTLLGDGTYGWYTAAWDNAQNHEAYPPVGAGAVEFETLVDSVKPLINSSTAIPLYINNQGTFGGTPPPVTVTSSVWDANLAVAAWGVRNLNQIGNSTMYFTCNFTQDPSINQWSGDWYFINGVLVTATIAPENNTDFRIFGDVNGTGLPGTALGSTLPDYYATFDGTTGLFQSVYATNGTVAYTDDYMVYVGPGGYFQAYRYDEGSGYVVTTVNYTYPEFGLGMPLTINPIVDGQYAVVTTVIDYAQNSNWTNETHGDPVVTVDNYAPDADATGPLNSIVQAFNVSYNFVDTLAPNGATRAPVVNVTLWYQRNGTGWNLYGNDPTPGDGLFPVDTGLTGGDGTYDWFLVSYDMAGNHEALVFTPEASTLVDTLAPTIDIATASPMYINTQGTFGGTAPPVSIWTNATDNNLLTAAIGIRNREPGAPNYTYYVSYNFTVNPGNWNWDGNWHFVNGELVTACYSPVYGTDTIVWGEVNGANATGTVIGNTLPSHYVVFGLASPWTYYETHGTITLVDDTPHSFLGPDVFKVYRYVGGQGYVVGGAYANPDTMVPGTLAAPDGQYAVVVSALDTLGQSNYRNETGGNPVITVDNQAPIVNPTGPLTSNVQAFNVTYTYSEPAPSSGLFNLSLWYNLNGTGWLLYPVADPTPGDGMYPVDTSLTGGDGTYDWFMIAYDNAMNHEPFVLAIEATTLVDTVAPVIDITGATPIYINNQGTYGGTPPPVNVTATTFDINLLVATWGVRNLNQIGNSTLYFTCNFTASPSTYAWSGDWYFINGVLVTATVAPENNTDLRVFGDVNGTNSPGTVIGNVLPDYYASFDGTTGLFQSIYATNGTVAYTDDYAVYVGPGYFQAYRYDEGSGYIVTTVNYTNPEFGAGMPLTITPIVEGQYAVIASAIDSAQNRAWVNETNGKPVITVDNTQPTLTTAVALSTDVNSNGHIDTGDTITGWVNVTDANEDGTCAITIDVDETGFPNQATAPVYMGGGSWQFTYVVQGPQFTTSNIDVDFRDLAGNQIIAADNTTYDIYGTFNLAYSVGWNIISIPVLNPMVGGVPLAAADDLGTLGSWMVSKWDAAGQRYINYIVGFHTPADPQNFALVPDEAYWIWMPANGAIAVAGELAHQRTANVVAGWNLVGYMNPTVPGDVGTDWAPQVTCGAYDDIAYYNGAGFTHYIFSGTVMALTPGTGYFVWSDGPATIVYGS